MLFFRTSQSTLVFRSICKFHLRNDESKFKLLKYLLSAFFCFRKSLFKLSKCYQNVKSNAIVHQKSKVPRCLNNAKLSLFPITMCQLALTTGYFGSVGFF